MKNRLSDLNDHLFAQLERLSNEELSPEQLKTEIDRGQAIAGVADQIVRNAALQLQAVKLSVDFPRATLPTTLEAKPALEAKPNTGRPQ